MHQICYMSLLSYLITQYGSTAYLGMTRVVSLILVVVEVLMYGMMQKYE